MARKRDELAAAKAKKQKIILIVGGVLLLGVAAIQVPKLLGGGSETAAAPAPTETTGAVVATGTTSGGATVAAAATVSAANTGAVVAGVALPREATVRVPPSKLVSFTLFEAKDPFAPQANEQPTAAQIAADAFYNANGEAPPPSDPGAGTGPDTGSPDSGGTPPDSGGTTPAPKPPPVVFATINLDGKMQQMKVGQPFPVKEPLFVLRSLTKKQAKIGVAGGSFDDGQTVALAFGKKLTLVNTATGVRYVLRLVYTGAEPEPIEGFTKTAGTPAAAGAAAATTTTTTTAAG